MAVAAIATLGCIAGIYGFQSSEKESKSALTIANIEALSRGEVTVVGCKKASGCSCYIFDGSGTLVGKEKNQAPYN